MLTVLIGMCGVVSGMLVYCVHRGYDSVDENLLLSTGGVHGSCVVISTTV